VQLVGDQPPSGPSSRGPFERPREDGLIRAEGVEQRYRRRRVLTGLDLSLGAGVTALMGPNGAGKTTLLHLLVGLRQPRAGRVSVLGVDLRGRGALRQVAPAVSFLPQVVPYVPNFTVAESVGYAAWLKGVDRAVVPGRVSAALAAVGLQDRARTKMRTLSGGMLRRAGIAQAVVSSPAVLVLDEPTAGLDPQQRVDLRRTIRELGLSTAVLLSTHAADDVAHVADRVLVLAGGQIGFDGDIADLEARADSAVEADTPLESGYLAVVGSAAAKR